MVKCRYAGTSWDPERGFASHAASGHWTVRPGVSRQSGFGPVSPSLSVVVRTRKLWSDCVATQLQIEPALKINGCNLSDGRWPVDGTIAGPPATAASCVPDQAVIIMAWPLPFFLNYTTSRSSRQIDLSH